MFAAIFCSCKKTVVVSQSNTLLPDSTQDKEVRIEFPIHNLTMGGLYSYIFLTEDTYIYDFDKRDYLGVDSITFNFNGFLRSGALVRLYNITDSIIINGSIVRTNTDFKGELHSKNIYNSLPEKKITIAIRYTSGAKPPADAGTLTGAFLKLRKD